ncbi:LLM class flavin-dependent oxidoreductase [Ornithinimicrobium cryptoxanthini]|uniref:LLM class flavin-dependent oxidoreductase n=1 Tax=Ornithinimicrobium cryptoxanthini TaxID=2934161 RepID=UPI0021180CBC|nr:LLM class flavin-dependent oxidoreductase [Ornithinimicrobium cryptoxanthini]
MSDYGHELQFGTFHTPTNAQPQQAVSLAQLSERAGLDLVTFQDHPYQPGFLDTWTLLSYVAARTERVHLAPNVANLPLRQPAVLARSVASLDLLSNGRVELGLGTGAFWDAMVAMGVERRTPGESVQALQEAIAIIRGIWAAGETTVLRVEGQFHHVAGAKRGPAPAHHIGIWLGVYKPRMLRVIGRLADGWLPSEGYLSSDADLGNGNKTIDGAAQAVGRDPREIRRLLNISRPSGSVQAWVERLAELAVQHGTSTFILAVDDPGTIELFGQEVAPAVREIVARQRQAVDTQVSPVDAPGAGPQSDAEGRIVTSTSAVGAVDSADGASGLGGATGADGGSSPGQSQYDRLGVHPTPDDGTRLSETMLWDESTRPRRAESGPEVTYSAQGAQLGKHLIDVHDMLRDELTQVRSIVDQVKKMTMDVGSARSSLNEMTMKQNNWTLGAYCSRYCATVTQHHGLEDASVFPHLRAAETTLAPVLDRLEQEHVVIHDVIEAVDRALVAFVATPDDFSQLDEAVNALTDTLLSHLSYEEEQLVEPLARVGFYPGQA